MTTTMKRKAFVLLSGGIDSTTCLYKAYEDFNGNVEAVSMNYGQRHIKEMDHAAQTCGHLGISHIELNLANLLAAKHVMLTKESEGNVEIPDISYDDIKGVSPTYVPFRNGTMLSILTAHAQKYVMENIAEYANDLSEGICSQEASQIATNEAKDLCGIYFGAHAEDAHNWAYPDCTPEFIGAMANAIYIGSYFTIRLYTPFAHSSKAEIIMKGVELDVDYSKTWSCYAGKEKHCGTCPTCRARKQAFSEADAKDPTEYEV